MAFVSRYGNIISEDGWRMVDEAECVWSIVPGSDDVHLQVRSGIPTNILVAFAARFNQTVEPLRDHDSACWTPTNTVATSNHMAGTAMDLNWELHPFRTPGTFGDRLPALRRLLDEFEGCVWWGGDWDDPIDEMHFQLNYREGYLDVNDQFVLDVDERLIKLVNDLGFLPAPHPADVAVLADAMGGGVSNDRYAQLLPAVSQCLNQSECTTLERITMWVAQIGEESGGLRWMEEIASGAEYEGRGDLGNTEPGDGERFKGRGPIQVTGRAHYGDLSAWAFSKGLVPSPTFFIDAPPQLASDQYGFIGATWYWTVERPQINGLCDAGDLEGVTRAINGGLHGIDERRRRWEHAKSMGDILLQLLTATPAPPPPPPPPPTGEDWLTMPSNQEKLDFLYNAFSQPLESRSEMKALGEGTVGNLIDLIRNMDGALWEVLVVERTKVWDANTLALLHQIALADPVTYPDRQNSRQLARAYWGDYAPKVKPPTAVDPAAPPASTAPPVLPPAPPPPQIYTPHQEPPIQTLPPQTALPPAPVQGEVVDQPAPTSDWKQPVVDSLNMLLKFDSNIPAEAVEAAEKLIVALSK